MWLNVDVQPDTRIDMCLKQIGLQVQNTLTILELIISIIGQDVYDYLMSTGIFSLILNSIFI